MRGVDNREGRWVAWRAAGLSQFSTIVVAEELLGSCHSVVADVTAAP
jgi:hypothetical protein